VSAYLTQRRRVGNMPSRRESTQHFLLAHVLIEPESGKRRECFGHAHAAPVVRRGVVNDYLYGSESTVMGEI
jgi:hypothetical protein